MSDPCSHTWIDPQDAPIARHSYAPIIGPGRSQMKPRIRYVCQRCGLICVPTPTDDHHIVMSFKRDAS